MNRNEMAILTMASVYKRVNPWPIDYYEIFNTFNEAYEYVSGKEDLAYPGQTISVINDNVASKNGRYFITKDKQLQKIGESGSGGYCESEFKKGAHVAILSDENDTGPNLEIGKGYFLGDAYFIAIAGGGNRDIGMPPSGLKFSSNNKVLCEVAYNPDDWFVQGCREDGSTPPLFGNVDLYESTLNLTTINDVKNYVIEAILEGRW